MVCMNVTVYIAPNSLHCGFNFCTVESFKAKVMLNYTFYNNNQLILKWMVSYSITNKYIRCNAFTSLHKLLQVLLDHVCYSFAIDHYIIKHNISFSPFEISVVNTTELTILGVHAEDIYYVEITPYSESMGKSSSSIFYIYG